jgi:hypothetical protein
VSSYLASLASFASLASLTSFVSFYFKSFCYLFSFVVARWDRSLVYLLSLSVCFSALDSLIGSKGMATTLCLGYSFIGVSLGVVCFFTGEGTITGSICIGSAFTLGDSFTPPTYRLSGDGLKPFEALRFCESASSDSIWSELCISELSLLWALEGRRAGRFSNT